MVTMALKIFPWKILLRTMIFVLLLYYFEQKVGVMKNLLWTLKCRGPMVITFLVWSHLCYDIFEIY